MFVKEVTTGLITYSGLNNVLEDETRNSWTYNDIKPKISISSLFYINLLLLICHNLPAVLF